MPKAMWAEAGITANFVSNRIPRMGDMKTRYELFCGKKPVVANLRAFGCRAVVLALKKRCRKLEARGQVGTFVGYSQSRKESRVQVGCKVVESSNFGSTKATSVPSRAPRRPSQLDGRMTWRRSCPHGSW